MNRKVILNSNLGFYDGFYAGICFYIARFTTQSTPSVYGSIKYKANYIKQKHAVIKTLFTEASAVSEQRDKLKQPQQS